MASSQSPDSKIVHENPSTAQGTSGSTSVQCQQAPSASALAGDYAAPSMPLPGQGLSSPSAPPGVQPQAGINALPSLPEKAPQPYPYQTDQYSTPMAALSHVMSIVDPDYAQSPPPIHAQGLQPSISVQGETSQASAQPTVAQPGLTQNMQYTEPTEEELKKQQQKEKIEKAKHCMGETCIVCRKMGFLRPRLWLSCVAGWRAC